MDNSWLPVKHETGARAAQPFYLVTEIGGGMVNPERGVSFDQFLLPHKIEQDRVGPRRCIKSTCSLSTDLRIARPGIDPDIQDMIGLSNLISRGAISSAKIR